MAKRKLFKVSKEFNLGKDTLTAFLQQLVKDGKADIQFKGPNTVIEDNVFELISQRFAREKQIAERIVKKRQQRHDENEIPVENFNKPEEMEKTSDVEIKQEEKKPEPEVKKTEEKPEKISEQKNVAKPKEEIIQEVKQTPKPEKKEVSESSPKEEKKVQKTEKKDFSGDRNSQRNDRKDYSRDRNNNQRGDRRDYSRDRNDQRGDRRDYSRDRNNNQRGDRRDYSRDRNDQRGERKDYSRDRNNNQRGERKDFSRDRNDQRGERKDYSRDRNNNQRGERKDFSRDRNNNQRGERKDFSRDRNNNQRGERKDFSRDRNNNQRGDRREFSKDSRSAMPKVSFEKAPATQENQKDVQRTKPVKPKTNAPVSEDVKKKRKREAMQKLKKKGKDTGLANLGRMISNEEGATYRKKRKNKKEKPKASDVQANIRQTLNDQTKRKRKKIKKKQEDGTEIEVNVIKINEYMSTQDLATLLEIEATEIIKKCMLDMGLMVTMNQRLDLDTIRLLAEEYGYEIEEDDEFGSENLEEELGLEEDDFNEESRPPIITVMGHVDHGKTSLLDYIREANVVAGESGGITQHIGAYEVQTKSGQEITFLDTPGHEAFTAMRARGTQVTDVVILIVAADDGVMPQTREAIDHAKAAGVPFVVAITKIDKPGANPDKVLQMLSEYNVMTEEWGGEIQVQKVSSKTGEGIDELLDKLIIEAEVLELKAAKERAAKGVVVESKVEKGKGTVATILVQDGTLNVGDYFIVGPHSGKVKAMFNERGQNVKSAGPSVPVQIIGIDSGVPQAGDKVFKLESAQKAKEISRKRTQLKREHDFRTVRKVTLDDISKDIKLGGIQEMNLIIKGDVDGSVEALADSLIKLNHDEVRVNVVRKAVGAITESDVILASASGAIIMGFHVKPTSNAKLLAEQEKIEIRYYKIVYDAINEVHDALEGMLRPEIKESIIGGGEIQEIYKISKIGNIAGTMITSGRVKRDSNIRVIREGIVVHEGKLSSLKRFQDDAKDVIEGFDCGITIENFNDVKKGDTFEFFETVEIARKLNDAKK
jgi:translation initiation factor IF-2